MQYCLIYLILYCHLICKITQLIFFKKNQLYIHNFADNNTISAVSKGTDDLLITLKNESVLAVKWFSQNNINSDRFQAMVLQKQDKNSGTYSLDIDNKIRKCSYMRQLLAVLWKFELLHILIIYFLIT